MDIIFRGQHLTIAEGFKEHATERLNKLSRYLPSVDHAIVDVRHEAKGDDGRYVVQVTLSANGTFLRAEERNFDLSAAVDAAGDALSRQVTRYKEKKVLRSERRVEKEGRVPIEQDEPEPEQRLPRDTQIISGSVVRIKKFHMKPMTEAEAIDQMELLGHNFFLFQDADRDQLALLYRRQDKDYGMILQDTE
jgi:ribosomal subunit interface protein